MLNRYAIIYPAFTFGGDGCGDMPYLLIAPLHKCRYERICGYSLGHEPVFYDTLKEAQQAFVPQDSVVQFEVRQNAIVEFQVKNESVINLTKIFEIEEFEKLSKPVMRDQNTFFKSIKVPAWNEKNISDNDLSAKALEEFNKYYEANGFKNKINREHKL